MPAAITTNPIDILVLETPINVKHMLTFSSAPTWLSSLEVRKITHHLFLSKNVISK